ncbi:MAG: tyrosine-protein phosphatase [Hellea sp.]
MKTILINTILVLAFAGLAACGSRSGDTGSELAEAPRIEDARLLPIHGTRNFRDLGGYKTIDGRAIKSGMLYRSDKLSHLEDAGVVDVAELSLKVITDLRSDSERKQEPDHLPQDVDYVVLPINDKPVDIRKLSRKIIMGRVDEAEVMNLLDHRRFITNPAHRKSWGEWVKSLADDNNTPQLFHCTSGKDRTGYGAAIIMLTLGVDKDTVMEDFLFSNQVLKGYNDATIISIEKRVGKRDSLEIIRKIMGVSRETMEATFAQMEADFGSIDGFIRDGLGIDDDMRAKLQDKFLEQ